MTQENITSNKDEITNVVNSEPKQIDNSNPVEEKTIQNAEITREQYIPVSEVCDTAQTVAPVQMLYEMNKNLKDIDRKVRGIDLFVMEQLGYKDMIELCHSFNAEQVDAIASCIHQIEQGKAIVIGDQTGIGKGRILAGVMRYAKKIGKKPIFITEKPNLFSDIYRDIIAIGLDAGIPLKYRAGEVEKTIEVSRQLIISSMKEDIDNDDFDLEGYDPQVLFKKGSSDITEQAIDAYRTENFPDQVIKVFKYETNKNYNEDIQGKNRFVPFIVNGSSSKTEIKDADGNILYKGLPSNQNSEVLSSKSLSEDYDCIIATYSQFSSMQAIKKVEFIMELAKNNIILMDESHNASGSSRRGSILQNIVAETKGVVFASATYAKRPDNMPIYAMKTSISDAELTSEELITAIIKGGVAMQEILSSQLVAEGQMMRRERSYEGIEINYITLDESVEVKDPDFNLKNSHYVLADKFLSVIREIISFVKEHVNPIIDKKRKEWIEQTCGIEAATAILYGDKTDRDEARQLCKADLYNNSPYVGIFNIVNQLYFSIKAEAVANWAIYRMKQGKKPIIALASTLESVLDYALEESEGSKIDVDFSVILKRRLAKAIEYTTLDEKEISEKHILEIDELNGSGQLKYEQILESIENLVTGITISPIDLIKKIIAEAGFTVEEVTGRTRIVDFDKHEESGIVKNRIIPNATDVFSNYNNNIIDCLIINQAGSTGSSAHAIKTNKVTNVDYENGIPVVPTSLENRDYVQQRCMINIEAELDVNKEVQKRGRTFRTGQIFNPQYDYLISAIPSEKRLMMMLRKKLRSLDANTSSNQKQSTEILDVVDFLNQYGDEVVAKFLSVNPDINSMIGSPISFEVVLGENGEKEYVPVGSINNLAYNVTGRVAILSTEEQELFYNQVTEQYLAYQAKLIQEGRWNLEVDNLDLQAKTIEKEAISIGNANKKSVFGGATFLELCEVNNIRKPFAKIHLRNLLSGTLTDKDVTGNLYDITVDEYIEKLHVSIDERANAEYNHFKPQYIKAKQREIEVLLKDKRITKIKSDSAKQQAIKEQTERIINLWDDKINSLEDVFEKASKYKEIVSFFSPKSVISYFLQKQYFDGISIGVKMDKGLWLSPYAFSLRIAFPSTLRYMEISFANISDINAIINSTLNRYNKFQREIVGKNLFNEWEERIKDSAADRVKRYIVTGNILKAYSIPELSNGQNRLISYSTIDKKVKKGILLSESFNPSKLMVKIPLEVATNIVTKSLGTQQAMAFGDDDIISIIPRNHLLNIRRYTTKKRSYHIERNNELNQYIDGNWIKNSDYTEADVSGEQNISKVVEILYSLGFHMNMYFDDFKVISKNFDIEDRFKDTDGIDEMLRKYNENLEKYEREQDEKFSKVPETVYKRMDEMEKELYDLRKEKENNKALRFFVDSLSFAKKYKNKEMSGKFELGGELNTIADVQEDDTLHLITNSQEVKEILSHFSNKFDEIDEMSNEPYSNNIGGIFVRYGDGDITHVYAYEGTVPSLSKPVFEIFPNNTYF